MLRIGFGYDVHKLVEGRKLIIGGVEIQNEKGALGHSDADVLLHAIADSLLGATALGDIGKHFPDTDSKYKNISSLLLLEQVNELIKNNGYKINNIDSTILLEKPKILKYSENMKVNIAKTLSISVDQISIKATTSEGMGFVGYSEGIACYAVSLIMGEHDGY
jgi:2-C-methyl-D-erythritol 2,4-cyclodiphosphate synthase